MNVVSDGGFLRFLSRVRARLWLDGVLGLLLRFAWPAALVLLVAGLIHVFVTAVPWQLSLTLTASIVATGLAGGLLFRRPTLDDAALAADRRLRSKELFISALEVMRKPPDQRPASAPFVLRQAEKTVLGAPENQVRGPRMRSRHGALIPFAVGLAGLVLHLDPGRDLPSSKEPASMVGPAARSPSSSSAEPPPVLALKRELERLQTLTSVKPELVSEKPSNGDQLGTGGNVGALPALADTDQTGKSGLHEAVPPEALASLQKGLVVQKETQESSEPPEEVTGKEGRDSSNQNLDGFSQTGPSGGDAAGGGVGKSLPGDWDGKSAVEPFQYVDIERRPAEKGDVGVAALLSKQVDQEQNPMSAMRTSAPVVSSASEVMHSTWFRPSLAKYTGDYFAKLRESQ